MSQLPSVKLQTAESSSGIKMAVASLPENSVEAWRKSAVAAVRRPPAASGSVWAKAKQPENGQDKSVSRDSRLYSAEGIKASVREKNQRSNSVLRSINRSFPVRLISYSVFSMLILAVGFIVLQFAGLVELRYQTDIKAKQLAALQHQQDELTIELEQMTALSNIESQAKALGMVYPNMPVQLDMSLAKAMELQNVYALAKNKR